MGRKSVGDITTELTTALLVFIGSIIIFGLITKWLWNGCLIPAIDGIHEITFWQAVGLNILFSILFKVSNYKKEWME